MSDTTLGNALRTVRRNWWIPVLAAVLAAAVAAVPAMRSQVVYTATSTLSFSQTVLNVSPLLPGPDTMIAAITAPDFAEKVAAATNVGGAEVTLGAYSAGTPVNRVVVSATSDDQAAAKSWAAAAGRAGMRVAAEKSEPDVGQYRTGVESAKEALDTIDSADGATTKAPDVAFYRWQIENGLAVSQRMYTLLQSLYTLDPQVSVSASSPLKSAVKNGLGGAIVGFALGVLIVAIREVLERRRTGVSA